MNLSRSALTSASRFVMTYLTAITLLVGALAPATVRADFSEKTQKNIDEINAEKLKNAAEAKAKADEAAAERRRATPSKEPVEIFSFKDTETGLPVKFMYEPASREELIKSRPSQMRKIETKYQKQPGLAAAFLPEYMAFTIAQGITQSLMGGNDPVFLGTLGEESFSWAGGISFFGFMGGARATTGALQAFGLAYDPKRAKLNYHVVTPNDVPVRSIVRDEVFDSDDSKNRSVKTTPPPAEYKGGSAVVPYEYKDQTQKDSGKYNKYDLKGRPIPDYTTSVKVMTGLPRPEYLHSTVIATPSDRPTRFQRNFGPLSAPLSLTGGMLFSNLIHEALADKEMQMCAKASIRAKVEQKLYGAARPVDPVLQAQVDEACDKAWENWVETNKVGSYTPDFISMGAASLIDAYIVKMAVLGGSRKLIKEGILRTALEAGLDVVTDKPRGAFQGKVVTDAATGLPKINVIRASGKRYIPWVLRAVKIGRFSAGMHPVGRFVTTIGNISLFMVVVHPITPMIKEPWEKNSQGQDLTKRTNDIFAELNRAERNNWVWEPRPDSDFCTGWETDVMGAPTPNMNCHVPEQHRPFMLLRKLASRQTKWRQFLLQEAFAAHTSWQKNVSEFATMYGNATAFYPRILQQINMNKFDPNAKFKPPPFYLNTPKYGMHTEDFRSDNEAVREVMANARKWLQEYLSNKANGTTDPRAREMLGIILIGLKAEDRSVPLETLTAFDKVAFEKLPRREQLALESKTRFDLLYRGMDKLKEVLRKDPMYHDHGFNDVPLEGLGRDFYEGQAKRNPFMKLRLILGNPQPMPPGLAFIRELNEEEATIEKSTKAEHPAGIGGSLDIGGKIGVGGVLGFGGAYAKTMADYLAISMVCGPEVDPKLTRAQQIEIARDANLSPVDRFFDRIGWKLRYPVKLTDSMIKIAVQQHLEEGAYSESYFRRFKKNAVTAVWKGFGAEFRPPRIVEGVPSNFCDKWPKNEEKYLGAFDPHRATWNLDGKEYDGILDIIRGKTRPELIGTALLNETDSNSPSPFNTWWTANVDRHVLPVIQKYRANYKQILTEKYLPALTRNGPNDFVEYNGRRVKLGALASLNDDVRLYLQILGKTASLVEKTRVEQLRAQIREGIRAQNENAAAQAHDLKSSIKSQIHTVRPGLKASLNKALHIQAFDDIALERIFKILWKEDERRMVARRAEFDKISVAVMQAYEELGKSAVNIAAVEQTGAATKPEFDKRKEALDARLKELEQFVAARQSEVGATPDMLAINMQSMQNLGGLAGQLVSYWGVVRAIQVKGH